MRKSKVPVGNLGSSISNFISSKNFPRDFLKNVLVIILGIGSIYFISDSFIRAISKITISDFYTYYYIPKMVFSSARVFPYQNLTPLYPYFFPPPSIPLWYPLTLLPFAYANVVWAILNLILMILSALIISKIYEREILPHYSFTIFLFLLSIFNPAMFTFRDGQLNILLLFIITAGFYLSFIKTTKTAKFSAGFLYAVGTVTKISPFLLLLYAFYKREYKVFVSGLAFILIFVVLSGFTLGDGINRYYISHVFKDISKQGGGNMIADQSLNAFIKSSAPLKPLVEKISHSVPFKLLDAYSLINYVVVGILLFLFFLHKSHSDIWGKLLEYNYLTIVGVLGTGLAWYHQYTMLFFAFSSVFLLCLLSKKTGLVVLLVLSFVLMGYKPLSSYLGLWFPFAPWFLRLPMIFYGGVLLFVVNAYLLRSKNTDFSKSGLAGGKFPYFKIAVVYSVVLLAAVVIQNPIQRHLEGVDKARVKNLTFINNNLLKVSYPDLLLKDTRRSGDAMTLPESWLGINKKYVVKLAEKMSVVYVDPKNYGGYRFEIEVLEDGYKLSAPLESSLYRKKYGERVVLSGILGHAVEDPIR